MNKSDRLFKQILDHLFTEYTFNNTLINSYKYECIIYLSDVQFGGAYYEKLEICLETDSSPMNIHIKHNNICIYETQFAVQWIQKNYS